MTTAELLLKAAEVLRERKWIQGSPFDTNCAASSIQGATECCLWGALWIATGDDESQTWDSRVDPAMEAIRTLVVHTGDHDYRSVITWQDAEGRTKDEVLDVLERAAKAVA